MSMKEFRLTGLDGMNPLGFLAALGLLRLLEQNRPALAPRLAWVEEGRWIPVLSLKDDIDPVAIVLDDLEYWRADPSELDLGYKPKGGRESVRDLKPPPEKWSAFLDEAVRRSHAGDRRLAAFAAAFAPGIATDLSGYTKPTAFHFTAGQQKFVEMVAQLAQELTKEDLQEALFGPWKYQRELPVLRWDVRGERLHALLSFNPSKDKALGV